MPAVFRDTAVPEYYTRIGGVRTKAQQDLTSDVFGDLPFANIVQIATDRILGRTTVGTGDIEVLSALPSGVESAIDHGNLTGLADDDHTQYALLAGRSGGQTLIGGSASGDDLTLQSTSNVTAGHIFLGGAQESGWDETNSRLGLGILSPLAKLHFSTTSGNTLFGDLTSNNDSGPFFLLRKARGTIATPTAVLSGDFLAALAWTGYTGSAYGVNIGIFASAVENFTASAQGSRAWITTIPASSSTSFPRMTWTAEGNIIIGPAQIDSSTGAAVLIIDNGIVPTGIPVNAAGLYSADFSSISNIHAINESDELTRLTGPFATIAANAQETQIDFASTLLTGLSGASVTATNLIPAGSFLVGVTVIVVVNITGATTFDIGDGTDVDRWGAAILLPAGTTTTIADYTANGFGQFTAANNVVLTANGANFTGGNVRVTAHYINLSPATS